MRMMRLTFAAFVGLAVMVASCGNEDNEVQEARQERADYIPLLKEGKVWVSTNAGQETPEEYVAESWEFISGDTIINDVSYKRVFSYYTTHQTASDPSYRGAVREMAGKVYFVKTGQTEEELIYDFGLKVGDRMKLSEFFSSRTGQWECITVHVDSIEYKYFYDRNYKYLYLTVDNSENRHAYNVTWVEGVGALSPGFENSVAELGDGHMSLVCCMENDEPVFGNFPVRSHALDKGTDVQQGMPVP